MVPAICGRKLDDGMASSLPHDVAVEHRAWTNGGASRAAAHEYLCYGTVDGVSAICTDRASDDDQLRSDGRLSTVQTLVSHESRSYLVRSTQRRENRQGRRRARKCTSPT